VNPHAAHPAAVTKMIAVITFASAAQWWGAAHQAA